MFGMGPVEFLTMLGLSVVAVAFLLRTIVILGQATARRAAAGSEIAALTGRTAALEEELSVMSRRLEQLAQNQEFTVRLLSERKSAVRE